MGNVPVHDDAKAMRRLKAWGLRPGRAYIRKGRAMRAGERLAKGKANLRSQAYICEGSLILIGGTFVPEKKRTFVRKQGR